MRIQVANVALEVAPEILDWPLETFPQFRSFDGQLLQTCEWTLKTSSAALPKAERDRLLFDSGGSWAAFRGTKPSEIFIEQYTNTDGTRRPLGFLKIDNASRHVTLFGAETPAWGYPLDEILFLNAFSESSTLLVHSCSYEYDGQGYLFCGVSGAGKSTLAELLAKSKLNGQVLCDERNALTFDPSGKIWLSSTPWHGTGNFCVAKTVPLQKIILLDPSHQGQSLRAASLEQSIAEIMRVVFFPQFRKDGIEASVALLKQLLEGQRILRLNYDKSAIDVGSFLESELFRSQE